jgi:hypothetical protein
MLCGMRRRGTGRYLPLLAGGVLAGAAGTAAMSVTGRLHRLAVARQRGVRSSEITEILDYDDSEHVVIAAGAVVRAVTGRAPASDSGRHALFLLTHWGYGSAFGAVHAVLRERLGEPAAALAFYAGSQTMALGLFPVLGDTPVPWRWGPRLLAVSFAQHAVYAGAVAATDAAVRRRLR